MYTNNIVSSEINTWVWEPRNLKGDDMTYITPMIPWKMFASCLTILGSVSGEVIPLDGPGETERVLLNFKLRLSACHFRFHITKDQQRRKVVTRLDKHSWIWSLGIDKITITQQRQRRREGEMSDIWVSHWGVSCDLLVKFGRYMNKHRMHGLERRGD